MTSGIHDKNYYDWGTFMKKAFLPEKEIQQYEQMDSGQISSVFFQLGVQKGAHLFFVMLQSYRLAARVANAAWGYVQALNDGNTEYVAQEYQKMQSALRGYSPENFSPHRSDLEFAAECFESFYNQVAEVAPLPPAAENILFQWTSTLQSMAENSNHRRERATVEEVVRAARA